MPHLIVEYSANLEPELDMAHVVSVLHEAALATGVFPIGGVRVRASRRDLYKIADGHPDNAFIHVQARIGVGRTPEVRAQAAEMIFAQLKAVTAEVYAVRAMGLSLEIVEIDPVGSLKHNNLHEAVARRSKP
jgi:5-carboxymethyl-2-hydroxymuconate isomerase